MLGKVPVAQVRSSGPTLFYRIIEVRPRFVLCSAQMLRIREFRHFAALIFYRNNAIIYTR